MLILAIRKLLQSMKKNWFRIIYFFHGVTITRPRLYTTRFTGFWYMYTIYIYNLPCTRALIFLISRNYHKVYSRAKESVIQPWIPLGRILMLTARDARDHDRPIIRSISLSFATKNLRESFSGDAAPCRADSDAAPRRSTHGLTRRSVKRARTSVSGGISPDHFHLIDRPETLARICAPWIEGDTGTAISMGTGRAN